MAKCWKPIVALTMGDPAGIGPEICVETMLSKEVTAVCRPFVIGSQAILEQAAACKGLALQFRRITKVSEASYTYGVCDVLETGDYDADALEWGKVQKLAGRMAVDFIQKSIELGLAGEIDAVSTAPINKQAIKLAGVKEPGHTELYQHGTNSPYALTMFACHKLRVFFLSRHLSLADACAYITKDRVLQSVTDIDCELRKLGMEHPCIAVAALNPHGGDNGLFGKEEIDHLLPAIEAAQERGIHCIGPCPADSVFHIGRSGAYDAILSLYHDQGHIACKTLDFERSVTLTFGLPFIRASVDHGTAFDVAGKGIAQSTSMIESTKVAAEYAARIHNQK